MHKYKQAGASVTIAILGLAFIALVAVLVWRMAWLIPPPDNGNQQTPVVQQPVEQEKNILRIEKLGIQMELGDDLKASDVIFEEVPTVGEAALALSSETIAQADSNCSTNGSPFGRLSRSSGKYPENPNQENSSGVLIKQFEDFYIGYSNPQAQCTDNQATQELIAKQFEVFLAGFKTIVEISE